MLDSSVDDRAPTQDESFWKLLVGAIVQLRC